MAPRASDGASDDGSQDDDCQDHAEQDPERLPSYATGSLFRRRRTLGHGLTVKGWLLRRPPIGISMRRDRRCLQSLQFPLQLVTARPGCVAVEALLLPRVQLQAFVVPWLDGRLMLTASVSLVQLSESTSREHTFPEN